VHKEAQVANSECRAMAKVAKGGKASAMNKEQYQLHQLRANSASITKHRELFQG